MKARALVFILPSVLVVLLINSCATTPKMLIQSAESGDYAEVKRLIEEGVNVNARDWDGHTALMFASKKGNTEITKLLIDAGTDVYVQNEEGYTALNYADQFEQINVAELLREASAK